MGQQTIPGQRCEFYERHQQEETYAEIAQRYGASKACVRYWCRWQRDGVALRRHIPSSRGGSCPSLIRRSAMASCGCGWSIPTGGPGRIRVHLKKWPSLHGLELPSEASIGRYLRQWPCFRCQTRPLAISRCAAGIGRQAGTVVKVDVGEPGLALPVRYPTLRSHALASSIFSK